MKMIKRLVPALLGTAGFVASGLASAATSYPTLDTSEVTTASTWVIAGFAAAFAVLLVIPIAKKAFKTLLGFFH